MDIFQNDKFMVNSEFNKVINVNKVSLELSDLANSDNRYKAE